MISVIICSRNSTISKTLNFNICSTIGCSYELITIDNSHNKYSIFEAYNLGIKQSKNEYLCLIHDDLLFHTNGWGKTVIDIFNNNRNFGLISVAGSKIKTKSPSGWWGCDEKFNAINVIQHFQNKDTERLCTGFDKESISEVVVVDGLFLALRKDKRIRFNEKFYGFHNYDQNISFEYKKYGYKIIVTKDILIEHFSNGKIDVSWLKSVDLLHRHYKKILPLTLNGSKPDNSLEINNITNFIFQCLEFNTYSIGLKYWTKLLLMYPTSEHHSAIIKFLIKKILYIR
jgi:hypothetical protein